MIAYGFINILPRKSDITIQTLSLEVTHAKSDDFSDRGASGRH